MSFIGQGHTLYVAPVGLKTEPWPIAGFNWAQLLFGDVRPVVECFDLSFAPFRGQSVGMAPALGLSILPEPFVLLSVDPAPIRAKTTTAAAEILISIGPGDICE